MHVYYPGQLGRETTVALRRKDRAMKFVANQVREVPDADGRDLVVHGGFYEAVPLADAARRFGVADLDHPAIEVHRQAAAPASREDLDQQKLAALRTLADDLGLDSKGKKADLVGRLLAAHVSLAEREEYVLLSPKTRVAVQALRHRAAQTPTDAGDDAGSEA